MADITNNPIFTDEAAAHGRSGVARSGGKAAGDADAVEVVVEQPSCWQRRGQNCTRLRGQRPEVQALGRADVVELVVGEVRVGWTDRMTGAAARLVELRAGRVRVRKGVRAAVGETSIACRRRRPPWAHHVDGRVFPCGDRRSGWPRPCHEAMRRNDRVERPLRNLPENRPGPTRPSRRSAGRASADRLALQRCHEARRHRVGGVLLRTPSGARGETARRG